MPEGDDIVPIRLKRHQYARMKLMLAVAKYLRHQPAGYQNTVVRGTADLEGELRLLCHQTGRDFEEVVDTVVGHREPDDLISGNLDDGTDML